MPHSKTPNNISELLNDLAEENDNDRIATQVDRHAMYFDDYRQKVEDLIKTQFHKDNHPNMLQMTYAEYNFLKKMVSLLTVIYKKEADRKYIDSTTTEGEEITEVINKDFEELMTNSNINSTMQQVDLYARIANISACRIMLDKKKKNIKYSAVPAHEIQIEQDPEDPLCVVGLVHTITLVDSSEGIEKRHFFWTNGNSRYDTDGVGQYVIYNDDGELEIQPNNELNVNPYKSIEGEYIIPYVFYRTVLSEQFWNETANQDIYNVTLQANVNYTHKNNLMKFAAYDQKYAIGDIDVPSLANKKMDPTTIIRVKGSQPGEKADIKALSVVGKLSELDQAIFVMISQTADVHGASLTADAMSKQRQTAEALTINRKSLEENREKLIPLYREAEDEQAFKTIIIANTDTNNSGLGKSIPEDKTFAIDFADLESILTAKEQSEADTIGMAQNTINPVDIIKRNNPDLSDKQAKAEWERNKEINNQNRQTLSLSTPTQPGPKNNEPPEET